MIVAAADLDQLVNTTLNYNLNSTPRCGIPVGSNREDAFGPGGNMKTAHSCIPNKSGMWILRRALALRALQWMRLGHHLAEKSCAITPTKKDRRLAVERDAVHRHARARRGKIGLWAGCGVDGLKVDFFQTRSQHTMWQYEMIAGVMTRHHLMINLHGATKCMGEGAPGRTFGSGGHSGA